MAPRAANFGVGPGNLRVSRNRRSYLGYWQCSFKVYMCRLQVHPPRPQGAGRRAFPAGLLMGTSATLAEMRPSLREQPCNILDSRLNQTRKWRKPALFLE